MNTTDKRAKDLEEIAWQFARLMNQHLDAETMTEVRRRNRYTPGNVCHSHDFLDANMVMAEAFRAALRRDPDMDSMEDLGMWGDAWRLAKAKGFRRPTLSAVLRRYAFTLTQTGGGCTAWTRPLGSKEWETLTVEGDPMAPTRWTDTVYAARITEDLDGDNNERLLGEATMDTARLVRIITNELLNDYGCGVVEGHGSLETMEGLEEELRASAEAKRAEAK